jgi:glycosyltransferase involved in cell wall biosynthesis
MYDPQLSPRQNDKVRVLQIITRLTVGGDTNVVLDLADHFSNHPYFEAALAAGPVPMGETDLTHLAYDRGIATAIIPGMVNRINPLKNPSAIMDLRTIIAQGRFDIVHTHSSVAGVMGRIAAASAGVPVIVHHVQGWGIREGMSRGIGMLYVALERLCARFTSRLVAVSGPTIEKGLGLGIGTRDKYALIYNGIDVDKFSRPVDRDRVLFELGLEPRCKVVGMIGRLDEQKNPLDFIRAAAIVARDYPNVQFLIAGDGVLRPQCEMLIYELGLRNKFFLLGFRKDVERIVPAIDISALSSLWEGLPVVFQEAMSAGKPIVANDVDGVSDLVKDGETGYLVRPHRPDEMAERILYLLNHEDLSHQLGMTGQRRSKVFSTERMIESVETLYGELLSERAAEKQGAGIQRTQPRRRSA